MRSCRTYRRWIQERRLGELSAEQSAELQRHLNSCDRCRREEAEISKAVNLFTSVERPELSSQDWERLWRAVAVRIEAGQDVRAGGSRMRGRIGYFRAAAALLLLVTGALIGRFVLAPQEPPQQMYSSDVERQQLLRETDAWLESSKILLLGFVNSDPAEEDLALLDFSIEQQISGKLVSRIPELRRRLEASQEFQLAQLLQELELILLQIANLERRYDLADIELIRDGVENRALLFKINLEELRLRGVERTKERRPGIS